LALEWTISHSLRLVLAKATGDVSPREIESYFHGVGIEGGISYAKMFVKQCLRTLRASWVTSWVRYGPIPAM
jgi:hypothetical protein